MHRLEEYVSAGGKLLRCGYTTGTCAAAATRAAADLLLGGRAPASVVVSTPAGVDVLVDVEEVECGPTWARCAVRKDAGDDPDVTDGVLVYAKVFRVEGSEVRIDGGEGVGRVTRAGLDQPVGAAAINATPRAMIAEAARASAREHDYDGGLAVEISIPAGVELAHRTFNPRLGIEGGLSVLGTSGIVRPMSEEALVATIGLELRVLHESGSRHVLVVPGNYGLAFARDVLGLATDRAVTCSNYLGATIDDAALLGFESLLLVGHLGKLAKLAVGAMNLHSRVVDGRAEALAAHAALAGASSRLVARIMEAATTDAMLDLIADEDLLDPVMASLVRKMHEHLGHRAAGRLQVEAIVFSSQRGLLAQTEGAPALLAHHRDEGGDER